MKRFLLLFLVVLLSSCASLPAASPTTALLMTASPTESPTPLPTGTATATPSPTATASPTATPTQALPVSNGTPLPALEEYETITAENFMDLEVVARYGEPNPLTLDRLIENGKTAVVGMSDGLLFYDTVSGQQTDKLSVDLLRNYDITPDGSFILALAGDQLLLLNRSGETLQSFDASLVAKADMWTYPNPFAVSSTGKWVAIAEIAGDLQNDRVHIFEDGREVATVPGSLPTFSPDDTYLAILAEYGAYSVPYVYTTETWEKTGKLSMCEDVDCALTFSPDGSLLAVAQPDQVILYRTSDRKAIQWLQGWKAGRYYDPAKVSFSANNQYVLVYNSQSFALVFDLVNSKVVSNTKVERVPLIWLAEEGQIRVFDYPFDYPSEEGRWSWTWFFTLDDNGKSTLLLWEDDLAYLCHNEVCATLPLDGRILLDEQLNRYTIETNNGQTLVRNPRGETVMTLPFKADHLDGVAWLSNGYLVANFCPTETRDGCFGVVYNPKGQKLAGGDGCSLISSPLQDKPLSIFCFVGKELYMQSTSFLLDPESGNRTRLPDGLFLSFSSDGSMAAEYACAYDGFDHRLSVFDVSQNKVQQIISIPIENTLNLYTTGQLAFSPDKNTVVLDSGRGICAVNLKDQTVSDCIWMTNSAYAIAFSPDGKLLATYGGDGFIRVWAVQKKP